MTEQRSTRTGGGSEQTGRSVPSHSGYRAADGVLMPTPEPVAMPTSFLALVSGTLGDTARTANATVIVTTISKSAARVVLSIGLVLTMVVLLSGVVTNFGSAGSMVGGGAAVCGTAAIVGTRYLRARRARVRRRVGRHDDSEAVAPERPPAA
jgi:hypothetical protein